MAEQPSAAARRARKHASCRKHDAVLLEHADWWQEKFHTAEEKLRAAEAESKALREALEIAKLRLDTYCPSYDSALGVIEAALACGKGEGE